MNAATKRRCTICGGEGNHFFADHDPVYAESAAEGRCVSGNDHGPEDNAATSDPCVCKGWRGLWRVLLWGVPHVFCDGCNREVRDA